MEELILKLKKYPYLSVYTSKLSSESFLTTITINESFALKVNKYSFKIETRGKSIEESIKEAYAELIGILSYMIENIDRYSYRVSYGINNDNEMICDVAFQLTYLEDINIYYAGHSLKGKIEENVELVKSNLIKKLNSIKESIS
jgi:hypothetical protein